MDGYKEFFAKGEFDALIQGFERANFTKSGGTSLKIDGAPAIVVFNNVNGVSGVGFKTIIKKFQTNSELIEGKDYFNSDESIVSFMDSRRANFPTEDAYIHRTEAFLQGLKLSKNVPLGKAIWMDVLWSTQNEMKDLDGEYFYVKPNTIEYGISLEKFPEAGDSQFGAFAHTEYSDGKVFPISEKLSTQGTSAFIFTPEDFRFSVVSKKAQGQINSMISEFAEKVKEEWASYFEDEVFQKSFKRALKNSSGFNEMVKFLELDGTLRRFYDWQPEDDRPKAIANDVVEAFSMAKDINNAIATNYSIPGLSSKFEDSEENEGLVALTSIGPFKVVSDNFESANVAHIHSIKKVKESFELLDELLEKNKRLREGVEAGGAILRAWSSSKDPDLLKYYFNRELKYGLSGGSNFGFATYLVTEPPFTEAAEVGYSDEYRKKLYGENIFEFTIETSKIFFFDFDEYKKVNPKAEPKSFIEDQAKNLLGLTWDGELDKLIGVDDIGGTTSNQAMGLFKLLSRSHTQSADGTIRAPIDGFMYRGKNDGKTLVVWNSYALMPERMSKDCGKTWEDIDKNSPEYKEYLELSKKGSYNENESGRRDVIFDGNPTPEKEEAYKILMAFNSNDGYDEKGNPLKLSDGIFYNIQIKDNKEINATFRYNLPYTDGGDHYFRVRKNQFIEKLHKLGFSFGTIYCNGIKVGGDSGKDWTIAEVPSYYWPKSCSGGLKIVRHKALEIIDGIDTIPCDFVSPNLCLRKCEVTSELLDFLEGHFVIKAEGCKCDSEATEKRLEKICEK